MSTKSKPKIIPTPAETLCQFVPPFIQFLREGLAELNMSPARFQLLQVLSQGGATTMIELAGALSVTKRNVTTLVDGLEKDGLVTRDAHPSDRRSVLVDLTDHGTATFSAAAKVQRGHLDRLLQSLDPAQQAEMAAVLSRLIEALAERKQRP
ncbi:MAG: MarR family transcriptional regulator [Pseudomonadota bacterium]